MNLLLFVVTRDMALDKLRALARGPVGTDVPPRLDEWAVYQQDVQMARRLSGPASSDAAPSPSRARRPSPR